MVTEPEGQEQSQEEAAAPAEAVEPPPAIAEPAAAEAPSESAAEAPRAEAEPPASPKAPSAAARQETAAARPGRPADAGRGRRRGRYGRRKVCSFCVDHVKVIDYKDVGRLRRFLSDRGRIEPKRKIGTCAKHQRALSVALKRARHLALLPFTAEHIRQSGVASPRQ